MFLNTGTLDHRERAAILHRLPNADALEAEAESRERQQGLAAERALDAVLADSFPASDPPSWTLGVAHVPSETDATR